MSKIINLVLILITAVLAYWLYSSIKEPIAFNEILEKRKLGVIANLKKIQIAQDVFRMVTGQYANSFDTLVDVLENGKIEIVKLEADPSDPTNQDKFVKSVSYVLAKDSIKSLLGDISISDLRYVPYSNKKQFDIDADTITQQNNLLQVVQVGTRYKDFMGKYGDPRFKKYNKFYDPEKLLKFGDMNSPNTNGNW
ncbi:MAG: hypothetical protein IPL55_05200 [Saprospiraceae bacterium]|jgi:hypothetical protein|nr:hypothetical protein [Saprospiraceae bacterium]MBL0026021.1 hypothetical protein [Saprospiraceae bacterium]